MGLLDNVPSTDGVGVEILAGGAEHHDVVDGGPLQVVHVEHRRDLELFVRISYLFQELDVPLVFCYGQRCFRSPGALGDALHEHHVAAPLEQSSRKGSRSIGGRRLTRTWSLRGFDRALADVARPRLRWRTIVITAEGDNYKL